MGINSMNSNCFTQSSQDIFKTFANEIKLGEIKALNLAHSLAGKFGNNILQLEYQKLIEKKLGVNSMSMSLPSNEIENLLKSLKHKNIFEKNGIMLQAQFEKDLTNPRSSLSTGSHIFTIKFDKITKELVHQNSDQTVSRYDSSAFKKWSEMYDKYIVKMLSNRHSPDDLLKLFGKHAKDNDIYNFEFSSFNNSRHRSSFSPLLEEFLKRSK